jgi:signal transduction histidine kinase
MARAVERFSLSDLVGEYRALRASVLSLWLRTPDATEDLAQVVRFNEALDQLIAESVERYSGKLDSDADVFTASIGHDLRNPLNAIAMCAQVLETSGTLSQGERSAVHQIGRSAVRMSDMLGELQDFSRVRLGAMLTFERERLDVAGLCEKVVQEIRSSTPDRSITFSKAGNAIANVSRERVEQLVSNLVGNAVQHGRADSDVDVAVTGQDDVVVIDVHNAGPAIPAQALERIFEPLYRKDRASNDTRAHLGLGLYIARTIALAHGGDIQVSSTQATGTKFHVCLPREASKLRVVP